ncbi:MAG: tRNA (adenosine(37)-N6)-threonylcarbamoyltransferase complex transferase subunit TsaD [Candidatus Omnitrophica bacterium]|nr:tRNA (adenosine(37)-N6)-threonylcarbamoyltransferase complex transferase subunit TsaD [Candidatus Omnitrophota bacterium]
MITLGIETSCDETACAVLENADQLRSNIIASSLARHRPFGGIVPEIASRHTLESIVPVYQEALRKAKITQEDLSLVSVTYGPGLIGSLLVGVSFAKALSFSVGVPLIGVNHLHAHIYANFIGTRLPRSPFIGLVVSGGHTSVVFCKDGSFRELATTRDDACGEAFDKVAKMLGLGFPGGPVIEKMAKKGDPTRITFRCGQFKDNFDFSFSGIKTAVLYYIQKCQNIKKEIPDICASFQKAVVSDIVRKTITLAIQKGVTYIAVGGGVSANSYLRKMLSKEGAERGIIVLLPPREHSLDNGAMIARHGYALYKAGKRSDMRLTAVPGLGM